MRDKLRKFLYGRYGRDSFSEFTLTISLIFLLISLFLKGSKVYILVYGVAMGFLIYSMYRILSKDIRHRQLENLKYINFKNKIKGKLNFNKKKIADRKDYKYFKCEKCGQNLRVPKKKGRVTITCPKCKNIIKART